MKMNSYSYQNQGPSNGQLPALSTLRGLTSGHSYPQDPSNSSQATLPPLQTRPQSNGNIENYTSAVFRNGQQQQHATRSPQASAAPNQRISAPTSQIAPNNTAYPSQHEPQPYTPIAPNYSSGPSPTFAPPTSTNGSTNVNGTGSSQYANPSMTLPQPFFESNSTPNGQFPLHNPYQPSGQHNGDLERPSQPRNVQVVGSQGRRGVLPVAHGRVLPMNAGGDDPNNMRPNPVKGPDGKYACSSCNKVYLHLKHLKRHNLRHTGERPYQCYLCQETFCRSDILKRHFQKCSVRRGNPTGVNHLTHAQAHLGRAPQQSAMMGSSAPAGSSTGSSSTNFTPYRSPWQNSTGQPTQSGQEQTPNGQVGSNGPGIEADMSTRSNSTIPRPGSTDEKMRFPGQAGSLASLNNSIDTSPISSGAASQNGDRKPIFPSIKSEPQQQQQQPTPTSAYQAAPSTYAHPQGPPQYQPNSQSDGFPHYHYNTQAGYRAYPSNQYDPISNDSINNYFSNGGADNVMFSHPQ